jgi:chromate reductase
MNILALSGSRRAASINTALLRSAARIAPPACRITLFASLGELPLFNPDLEATLPASVATLRQAVAAADALLVASPEYAHGVSGTVKNALDWLVSYEGFVDKPVAVWNSSPRAHHAYDALLETLRTMSASIVREACVAIPLLGSGLDEEAMIGDPAVVGSIRGALQSLRAAVSYGMSTAPSFPV